MSISFKPWAHHGRTALLLALGSTLYGAAATTQQQPSSAQPTTTNNLEQNNLHRYFWASYQHQRGNAQESLDWYNRILKSEKPHYADKGYASLLFATGNYGPLLKLQPTIEKKFKDDSELAFLVAQALEKTGQQDEADKRYIDLQKQFKGHQEIAFQTINVYLRRKELENALEIIEAVLNNSPRKPNNFIFYFLQSQIYSSLGKKQLALNSVKKALELHPHFDKGWLLKAMLEEQMGKLGDAIKGYKTYLEIAGSSTLGTVEQHLLELTFKQKILQQKSASSSGNKPCIERAQQLFGQKEYAQALEQVNSCLETERTHAEANLLKIQILNALDHTDEAVTTLQDLMIEEPENEVWFKALHLMTRTTLAVDAAIKALSDVEKAHPNTKLVTLYLADLYGRAGNTEKTLTFLKKGLALTKDKEVQVRILFQMGLCYFDKKDYKPMKEALEKGYKLSTSFTPLSNLLAYYYATKGKNLTQAQKIISQVLKQEPTNPHFLDTQALIFYKEKKYAKAEVELKKLHTQEPQDATIARHLSKVYHRLGKHDQARKTLESAVRVAQDAQEKLKCAKWQARWSTHQS